MTPAQNGIFSAPLAAYFLNVRTSTRIKTAINFKTPGITHSQALGMTGSHIRSTFSIKIASRVRRVSARRALET